MKRMEENRFPQSATLFKFCREALELRYENGIKIIDQDVGALLNFDPADCSHWKKGKKSIKSLTTLKTLAEKLNTDERIVVDVAAGNIDLEEALFEYRGYGAFELDNKTIDHAKKVYYRNPAAYSQLSFEEAFDLDRTRVINAAEKWVQASGIKEAPVMLPELLNQLPQLQIEMKEGAAFEVKHTDGTTVITHGGYLAKSCTRFQLAREVFFHLKKIQSPILRSLSPKPEEILQIQANLFALYLLVPTSLLAKVVAEVSSQNDLISQVSEKFWVAKTLANVRLCLHFS